MQNRVSILLVILSLITFGGCSDESTKPEGEDQDSYVLQPGIQVVDVADLLDNSTMYHDINNIQNPEVWIKRNAADLFEAGDVIYCTPSPQVTDVFFLKITEMTTTKRGVSYYLVKTTQAALVDVFEQADIHKSIPLNLAEGEYELPDNTVEMVDTGNLSFTKLRFNRTKWDATCTGSNNSKITINRGTLEVLDPVLDLDIEIVNSDLKQFKAMVRSRNKLDADLNLDLAFTRSCEWYKEVFKLKKTVYTQAGPLPVVITYRFGIEMGFRIGGAAIATVNLDNYIADIDVWGGLEYSNPGEGPCEPERDCYDYDMGYTIVEQSGDSEPLLDAEVRVSFEAFVREEISVTLYKVIGPEFWMEQYAGPRVTWPHAECDPLQGYVELVVGHKMGGRLNCGFMKKSFGSWEFAASEPIEKVLWDECLPK